MSEENNIKDDAKKAANVAGDGLNKVKETVTKVLDADHDGDVDLDDLKILANKAVKMGKGIFGSLTGDDENK